MKINIYCRFRGTSELDLLPRLAIFRERGRVTLVIEWIYWTALAIEFYILSRKNSTRPGQGRVKKVHRIWKCGKRFAILAVARATQECDPRES